MSDSDSSSSQTQKSLGVNDESITDIRSGGPTLNLNNEAFEKIHGGINIEYAPVGLETQQAVRFAEVIGGGALSAADGLREQTAQLTDTLAAIASSATGTESEAGKIINKFAIPGLILGGLWLAFGRN